VAAWVFGGEDFVLAFVRIEMPGYHTGPCAHIGHLIGARHSHLDGAGYSLDQKWPKDKPLTPKAVVEELVKEEGWRQVLSSLVVCFFARGIYKPSVVPELLSIVGYRIDERGLLGLGREILKRKMRFKFREGFSFKDLRIPRRIFETPTPHGMLQEGFLREALRCAEELYRLDL